MTIELSILPHQEDFLKAVRKAFGDIRVKSGEDIHQNPLIDLNDEKSKKISMIYGKATKTYKLFQSSGVQEIRATI